MANYNWERIKEQNGRVDATVPDLKIGDCFLFEGEAKDAQGHVITDIYRPNKESENIIVQYKPEWTPVCNEGMYHYGKLKVSIKQ